MSFLNHYREVVEVAIAMASPVDIDIDLSRIEVACFLS